MSKGPLQQFGDISNSVYCMLFRISLVEIAVRWHSARVKRERNIDSTFLVLISLFFLQNSKELSRMSDNAISCAETAQQKKKNIFPINETIVCQKNSTVKGHTKNILVRSLIFSPLLCLRGLRFKVRNMLCRLFGRLASLLIFSIYK